MNEKDRREILKNMTPEQLAKANELYDQIKRFAEPEIDYENMTMDKINEYLLRHGYDPEQVGLRGKILADALIENVDLRAEVAALQAALDKANEDAERLADKLSEVVAYGGYYADIENRMPPDGQTFKVIAVSPSGVDDFTVLRMDGKLYFASDPPREVPNGFEIIRIKPWDVKTFGKTEEEDF